MGIHCRGERHFLEGSSFFLGSDRERYRVFCLREILAWEIIEEEIHSQRQEEIRVGKALKEEGLGIISVG